MNVATMKDWKIEVEEEDQDRIIIKNAGMAGYIHVRKTGEAFIVDIWPESYESLEATCAAHKSDLDDVSAEAMNDAPEMEVVNG